MKHNTEPRNSTPPSPLEIWAGVECTVNRVNDNYLDQLALTGHANRLRDLERLPELGIQAIRYPVLWERTAPDRPDERLWAWPDERLGLLRQLGIAPIVGLVHHGSGPRYTSLVDGCFADGLAQYAWSVAARYPWVESYTPVNEPLTTARFSGLYGHWYPHGRDAGTFIRALLNQCRAIVLSMRAIRQVNPSARLVQTEDLGKTYSTPLLAYQAEFENNRRWLSLDLLCGRVDSSHAMWSYLRWAGIDEWELAWFQENPCPPDIIGINYYVTSERFLDERLERYPEKFHGGNGRHRYADVEAVRVRAQGTWGHQGMLMEAWERYGIPLAITEVHMGCTREEQLRWLLEAWHAAQAVRRAGVPVQALTAWALFGACDWDSLVTRTQGHYEPGVFDTRGSQEPRATAIARLLPDLAAGSVPSNPVLATPGWWRRRERICYRPVRTRNAAPSLSRRMRTGTARRKTARPILITGSTGTLGSAFGRMCERRGLAYRLLSRQEMDIADPASVDGALDGLAPWAVINAAGYVRVDDAEREQERCFRENTHGPSVLAECCARRGIGLLAFSSDLVFDGETRVPYVESDRTAPLGVYGRSKAEAEERVLASLPDALVVRTSSFFGPWDRHNFLTSALSTLAQRQPFRAAHDTVVSPTYVPDLVNACLDLLVDGESGIWHLANAGAISWFELAQRAAEMVGLDTRLVEGCATHCLGYSAPRPRYSALDSKRANLLPSLDNALDRYIHESGAPMFCN